MSIFAGQCQPKYGEVTVCERNAELQAESSRRKTKNIPIPDYQRIPLESDLLRSPQNLARDDHAFKSAFVEQEQHAIQRLYSGWYNNGIIGALEELSAIEGLPRSVQYVFAYSKRVAKFVSDTLERWLSKVKLSASETVDLYSNIPGWSNATVKAFACHPHLNRIAVGLKDDIVKIICIRSDFKSILKEKRQKNLCCVAWRPLAACHLAVGCQNGIFLWFLDPVSQAARPNPSQLQILSRDGHGPITCLSWSKHGYLLVSASPNDSNIIVWNVANHLSVALNRVDVGVAFVSWSPCGQKLLSCSTSSILRVWDGLNWNCEKWSKLNGRCQVGCWSPCGKILIFTAENDSCLYYVQFYDKSEENKTDISGNGTAIRCCDLSSWSYDSFDDLLNVGGIVQFMCWDPTGSRLAITFRDSSPKGVQSYVALFSTRINPTFEISFCGFVTGHGPEYPVALGFTENYEKGALLNVCWSSGVLSQIPLLFHVHRSNSLYEMPQTTSLITPPSPPT